MRGSYQYIGFVTPGRLAAVSECYVERTTQRPKYVFFERTMGHVIFRWDQSPKL